MLKNKVKELLKNKKVLAVCAFVVVALGLAGATLSLSSSATSVNEVSKANEISNKKDNSNDNKVNSNKIIKMIKIKIVKRKKLAILRQRIKRLILMSMMKMEIMYMKKVG